MDPWTPTDQLKKRKTYMKRMEFMIRVRLRFDDIWRGNDYGRR